MIVMHIISRIVRGVGKVKFVRQKSPEDILQEEFLREKAQVLGRAGDSLARALEELRGAELAIEGMLSPCHRFEGKDGDKRRGDGDSARESKLQIREINREISRFNTLREYAKLRFYYLIVTREAMGMRRHERIEEAYRIPPSKSYLRG